MLSCTLSLVLIEGYLTMNDILPGGHENGAGAVANVNDATKVPIIVNGTKIEVKKCIAIREILAKAKDAGAIEGLIDEYVIERVEEDGELKCGETIEVTPDERFLAVPIGSTPVA